MQEKLEASTQNRVNPALRFSSAAGALVTQPSPRFLPAAKPRRSMDHNLVVVGGGGVVVVFCLLGKFCKNLVSEEEVWCEIVSWENLVILDHPVTILVPLQPQVYRAIALLFCISVLTDSPFYQVTL